MNTYEMHKEAIMELVASSAHQRVRPSDVKQWIARKFEASTYTANEILKDLVREGDLVYAYRDPCSYVEIPGNGCDGAHHAARPMKVVADAKGNPWLCDDAFQEAEGFSGLGCWECGGLAFTRSG